MEELIGVFTYFDKQLQAETAVNKKKEILLRLFLIECKYNVDILDLIKSDGKNDDTQIHEIINLLSVGGIERVISEKDTLVGDSFLIGLGGDIIKRLKTTDKENRDNKIENIDDSIIFNIYKRMLVLKAITKISKPYTAVKKINTLVRLKNLKKLLLIISKCNIK
jgi:hypothetical protein